MNRHWWLWATGSVTRLSIKMHVPLRSMLSAIAHKFVSAQHIAFAFPGCVHGRDLMGLEQLQRLTDIDLSACGELGREVLEYVGQLRNLRCLHLRASLGGITNSGWGRVGRLPSLTHLDLGRTRMTTNEFSILGNMTSLTHLLLQESELLSDHSLELVGRLKLLRTLSISASGEFSDAGLGHVGRLTDLKHSDASSRNRVTNNGMSQLLGLAALTYLGLSFCDVSDPGLRCVGRMTTLAWLDLTYTPVTDDSLASKSALTSLKWFKHTRLWTGHGLSLGVHRQIVGF
ncbi:unnamed protein product [Ostreobium quekettii]|uniref:Disease resistance R13L4/SHOC-2-like LRR domain-containing protein n=1 Tax=Ostreobium quekettii TaxID=121088 RepID=A0A8S1IPZ2_9CHLO|nr:unnamed protein product [Ostreobium quekettii]